MQLYDYQIRVKESLQQGKSVILQAPTGTGKTRAALAPYIEAFLTLPVDAFPRKCIYSVPMRVLANQFEYEYKELTASYQRKFRPRHALDVKIQTGERPKDPRLLGDLIFATIDQSLSSALAVPYSLSPGLANMNAGAFYSSYLVFDEFHLFPVDESGGASGALVTTLQLLAEHKGIVPFVLMTATFSSTMLQDLANRLGAEVVTVPKVEYQKIASGEGKQPRKRIYHVHEQSINADNVLAAHDEEGVTRSLVICNQVQRAQDLYETLRDHPKRKNIEICLLHSRFTARDRQQKEIDIRREFGKKIEGRQIKSLILVATQVVEVGLDITCDRLHTEIAPANAVFQRAGRCARYPGEKGHVYIYPVPLRQRNESSEPVPDYLPYPTQLCSAAWQSFQKRNGQELDFEAEQTVIDEVHTQSDRQLLAAMDAQRTLTRQDIFNAMEEHDGSYRQSLIRRIDSVTVLAANQPDDVGNPFVAEGFSLFRGSVHRIWRDLQAYQAEVELEEFEDMPWLMAYPLPSPDGSEDATQEELFLWREVNVPDLINTTAVVVINSRFCAYDSELGFRIVSPERASRWTSQPGKRGQGNSRRRFSYELESYAEHIERMLQIYTQTFQDDYAYVQRRLAEQGKLPTDGLDRAIRLAIAGHDLAKMDKRWQRWVRIYQNAIGEAIADPKFMAVHTHSAPDNPVHKKARQVADRQQKRPHHAGESAVAVAPTIAEGVKPDALARSVLTAIARHHSTGTATYETFELHPAAIETLTQVVTNSGLASSNLPIRSTAPGGSLEKLLIRPGQFESLLLYLYVVRVLRLCDGMSQEKD